MHNTYHTVCKSDVYAYIWPAPGFLKLLFVQEVGVCEGY